VQSCQQWLAEGGLREAVARVDLAALAERPSLRFLMKPVETWLGVSDLRQVDLSNSRLSEALAGVGQKLLNLLGRGIAPLIAGTGQFLVGFAVMLFVLFFALRDGKQTMDHLRHLLPLTRSQEDALLNRIGDVTRAVVFGTGITAVAQGVAAMIAFAVVGIPALFWGTVLAVASLIPVVGTAIVWVPAVGYLALVGKTGSALFLALWCIVVVGSIDNLLRPIVMGGRSGMSSLVVFFSVVGGIQLFGPMGIVYGPLIFGVCAVCIYIYELENARFLRSQARR
jgi:predicted PurR-regulated permease PerM